MFNYIQVALNVYVEYDFKPKLYNYLSFYVTFHGWICHQFSTGVVSARFIKVSRIIFMVVLIPDPVVMSHCRLSVGLSVPRAIKRTRKSGSLRSTSYLAGIKTSINLAPKRTCTNGLCGFRIFRTRGCFYCEQFSSTGKHRRQTFIHVSCSIINFARIVVHSRCSRK